MVTLYNICDYKIIYNYLLTNLKEQHMSKLSNNLLTKNSIAQIVQSRQERCSLLEDSITWIVKSIIVELDKVAPDWDVNKTYDEQVTNIIQAIFDALPGMEGYIKVTWDQEMQSQAVHRLNLLISGLLGTLEAFPEYTNTWMNSMATAVGLYIAIGEIPGLSLGSQLSHDIACLHYTTSV